MTEELKPCPLCGSTDLFLRDIAGWELDCRGCELSLVLANDPSREGLVTRWNSRSTDTAELSRLVDAMIQRFAREYRDLTDGQFGSVEDFPQVKVVQAVLNRKG